MESIQWTEYTAVERAITKTGIDYWLGFKNRDPNYPFHIASRLKISGIMNEITINTFNSRVHSNQQNETIICDYDRLDIFKQLN